MGQQAHARDDDVVRTQPTSSDGHPVRGCLDTAIFPRRAAEFRILPDRSTIFQVEGPLDLRATLRLTFIWGAVPWLRVDGSGVWYARRTPEGPGTLRIRRRSHELLVEAWGPGSEALLPMAPDLVGAHDPGMDEASIVHPRLLTLHRRLRGARLGRTGAITERLITVSLAQKVTGKGSKQSTWRMARAWGQPAPGPRTDLWLLPEPKTLVRHRYHDYHPFGIERRRADLVRRIALHATALDRALDKSPREARAHLKALPGIGPWTAGIVIGTSHGDPDSVPLADVHLPNWVAWNLVREPRADDRRMLEIIAPYAGQRGRVVRMVKGGGESAPRFGPRSTVRDIRGL